MVSTHLRTKDISKIAERGVFFDTNVLIYLFGDVPPTEKNWYSSLFKKLLAQRNPLYIDIIVISEFINVWLSRKYQNAIDNRQFTGTRKDFRDTDDGQQAMEDSCNEVKTILDQFQLTSQNWSKQNIIELLMVNNSDFNDKLITKICRNNNLILLTNDVDFAHVPIDILTTKKELLNS